MHKHLWREANLRLVPSAALLCIGIIIASVHGGFRHGSLGHKFVAIVGAAIFIFFAAAFLRVLTRTIYRLIAAHQLGAGRAASVQFVLRLVGYTIILLSTLNLVGIPIGKLLLGGAALGIILGVAAQQALGNFFASIVLIISHPYSVGEYVTINSGALGGRYVGTIKDIGLAHTTLKDDTGNVILMPNATLLSNAAIMKEKPAKKAAA